jgi:RNA polymerase sigma-70 factor (ECF subfamily)
VLENEASWIAQAQTGDAEAFTRLVEAYQTPVYNLCYRMLGDAGDAEDAAQETFLRAYLSIRRYDRGRPFPTWILSIAAHYCIDQIRKRRMAVVSMDESPALEPVDDAPGPETSLSRLEERRRMQTILEVLNPVDRALVVMYYWYDFSYEEIAKALELTLSAVKSRLHRARRSMAEEWLAREKQVQPGTRRTHGEVQSPAF